MEELCPHESTQDRAGCSTQIPQQVSAQSSFISDIILQLNQFLLVLHFLILLFSFSFLIFFFLRKLSQSLSSQQLSVFSLFAHNSSILLSLVSVIFSFPSSFFSISLYSVNIQQLSFCLQTVFNLSTCLTLLLYSSFSFFISTCAVTFFSFSRVKIKSSLISHCSSILVSFCSLLFPCMLHPVAEMVVELISVDKLSAQTLCYDSAKAGDAVVKNVRV